MNRKRRGVYRRTINAVYPGGSWVGYWRATIDLTLSCGHVVKRDVRVHGVFVEVPPRGLWCRECPPENGGAR